MSPHQWSKSGVTLDLGAEDRVSQVSHSDLWVSCEVLTSAGVAVVSHWKSWRGLQTGKGSG